MLQRVTRKEKSNMKIKNKTMTDKEFEKAVEKEWLKTSAYIELRKESGKDFISSKVMGEQAAIFALIGKVMEVLLESKSATVKDIKNITEMTISEYESK